MNKPRINILLPLPDCQPVCLVAESCVVPVACCMICLRQIRADAHVHLLLFKICVNYFESDTRAKDTYIRARESLPRAHSRSPRSFARIHTQTARTSI